MQWKMEHGKLAPQEAVDVAESAAKEFGVPVGTLLGTVECETDFRFWLVSSAGAVGPCQFLPKYKDDYYRYAGFEFDLETWDAIRGMAGVYAFYYDLGAKRYGYTGDDGWRYALLSHRYGQNSSKAKTLEPAGRVEDVERMMRSNGVWYSDETDSAPTYDEGEEQSAKSKKIAQAAMEWAKDKIGCEYSQSRRDEENIFDCSSLVARAYSAQGVKWDLVGSKIPNSTQEVYSDNFELLWPDSYEDIGKKYGGNSVIKMAQQAGDLQFLHTTSTSRTNKITHVTIVEDKNTIVHARGTKYGVCENDIDLYSGKVCAVVRFNPDCKLRMGMKGLRVQEYQRWLNKQGANIDADGIWGPKTEKAYKKYGTP